jgi:hypothetical protein
MIERIFKFRMEGLCLKALLGVKEGDLVISILILTSHVSYTRSAVQRASHLL